MGGERVPEGVSAGTKSPTTTSATPGPTPDTDTNPHVPPPHEPIPPFAGSHPSPPVIPLRSSPPPNPTPDRFCYNTSTGQSQWADPGHVPDLRGTPGGPYTIHFPPAPTPSYTWRAKQISEHRATIFADHVMQTRERPLDLSWICFPSHSSRVIDEVDETEERKGSDGMYSPPEKGQEDEAQAQASSTPGDWPVLGEAEEEAVRLAEQMGTLQDAFFSPYTPPTRTPPPTTGVEDARGGDRGASAALLI